MTQSADLFQSLPFRPAEIMLPQNCDMHLWSVVACDQYTSEPEYWKEVDRLVGNHRSTLRLILPESRLEEPNIDGTIAEINQNMSSYLMESCFRICPDALVYVERQLENGTTRKGLIGMVDLDQYDYEANAASPIRATERTVLSRIPPRVAVRENAPLELPHTMLLVDDPDRTVIEPLSDQREEMEQVYDFDLMQRGGHLTGWLLGKAQMSQVAQALTVLANPNVFHSRYGLLDQPVLLFAVGDGNHSLATAKECYEQQKKMTSPEEWQDLPSRFALVELINLHDDSLSFEPIHRLICNVDPEHLINAMLSAFPNAHTGYGQDGHVFPYVTALGESCLTIPNTTDQLPVGTLQHFLDSYIKENGGKLDYIHGEDVLRRLAAKENSIGFLLDAMGKEQLFPTVILDGVLPRKTFSMGEAHDKRFYMEARRIR